MAECGDEDERPASPPLYSELGKRVRELFNTNYHFGILHLFYRTKTPTDIDIEGCGITNLESMRTNAYFLGKFRFWGVEINEKWNSNNVFEARISTDEILIKGVQFDFDILFNPHTGKRVLKTLMIYRRPTWNLGLFMRNQFGGIDSSLSSMATYNNWLAGFLFTFDVNNKAFGDANFSMGYYTEEFFLHTNVRNGNEFTGSLHHKVNERLDAGVQLAWTSGYNATRFGLACKFKMDSRTLIAAKVNNLTQLGLSFSHNLNPCLALIVAALVDGQNFNQGGHKIGIGLKYEN